MIEDQKQQLRAEVQKFMESRDTYERHSQEMLTETLAAIVRFATNRQLDFDIAVDNAKNIARQAGWYEPKFDTLEVHINRDEETVEFHEFDRIEKILDGTGYKLDRDASAKNKVIMILVETDEADKLIDKGFVMLNDTYGMDIPS